MTRNDSEGLPVPCLGEIVDELRTISKASLVLVQQLGMASDGCTEGVDHPTSARKSPAKDPLTLTREPHPAPPTLDAQLWRRFMWGLVSGW